MTHYPPAYPLLLALVALLQHGDTVQAGRLLAVLFFGANVALFGLAVFLSTKRSWVTTGCAICIFVVSAPILSTHSMAWSEAPYITFTLAALLLLSLYVVRPSLNLILAASLCVGCAMATRYVGVTLLVPLVCDILVFGKRPLKQKIGHTLLAATVALLPLVSWVIRNSVVAETATNRTLALHLFGLQHTQQAIATMYEFILLPISIPQKLESLQVGVPVALFLVSIMFLHRKGYLRRNWNAIHVVLPTHCIAFHLTYSAFLVLSISVFDAQTPLDYRILLPAFLVIVIVGIALAWSLSSALDSSILRFGLAAFVFLLVLTNSDVAVSEAVSIHKNGKGYTALAWQDSQTIASVRSLANGRKVYSNGHDAIIFLTGIPATSLPFVTDPLSRVSKSDFNTQLQAMCREVAEDEAIVVYLNAIGRWYLPTLDEVQTKCGLLILEKFNDGAIYRRPSGNNTQEAGVP